MPCTSHSVILYAYLKRSQILLTISGHQVMHSVFCFVLCVEVGCKGLYIVHPFSAGGRGGRGGFEPPTKFSKRGA